MQGTIDEEMRALSEALSRSHASLDHSMASLVALESLAADGGADAIPTRQLGAYLGEVIRRTAPEAFAWALEGETPVLVSGSARWYPVEKVRKRRSDGPRDAVGPFAALALSMVPGAAERTHELHERVLVERGMARVRDAVFALRAEPSSALLVCDVDRALHGELKRRFHGDALRLIALGLDELLPHLAAAPVGRGYARRDPGRTAAVMIAGLCEHELVTRDAVVAALRPLLQQRNKTLRTNVVHTLTKVDLLAGSAAVAEEFAAAKDRASHEGVLRALGGVAANLRYDARPTPVPLSALVALLTPFLVPSSPLVEEALSVVNSLSHEPAHRANATGFLSALESLGSEGDADTARIARTIVARSRRAAAATPEVTGAARAPTHGGYIYATGDGAVTYFVPNQSRMSILRELMREVGAVTEPGHERALRDGPAVHPDAAPIQSFMHPSETWVTPAQCRVIAARMRDHMDVVHEVATFFDDIPQGSELSAWVSTWAEFHARAAELGGHRITR